MFWEVNMDNITHQMVYTIFWLVSYTQYTWKEVITYITLTSKFI